MRNIGTKYRTTGDISRFDGEAIPIDEPLILFRGRDRLVPQLLDHYKALRIKAGGVADKLELLQEDIDIIKTWQAEHHDRTKMPD